MLNRVSANSKTIANLHDRKVIKRQNQDAVKSFQATDAPSAKSLLQWQLQNIKSVSCMFCFTHIKIPNDSLAQELCKLQKFRGWAEKLWGVMSGKHSCPKHTRKLGSPGAGRPHWANRKDAPHTQNPKGRENKGKIRSVALNSLPSTPALYKRPIPLLGSKSSKLSTPCHGRGLEINHL